MTLGTNSITLKKITLFLTGLMLTIGVFANAKPNYKKALKIFENHVQSVSGRQPVFMLTSRELKPMRDSLENMSNRIILFGIAVEADSVYNREKNEQLVAMRKVFLNTIFQKMLKLTVDDISTVEMVGGNTNVDHYVLAMKFASLLPVHGSGIRTLPVKDNPQLNLFF